MFVASPFGDPETRARTTELLTALKRAGLVHWGTPEELEALAGRCPVLRL